MHVRRKILETDSALSFNLSGQREDRPHDDRSEAYVGFLFRCYSAPKLFRESANIEANEHFDREAQALPLGSGTDVNLEDAMAGEHYENVTMYVDFANQAEADGDVKVAAMFRQIAVDEGTHYEAYRLALAKITNK